MNSENNTQQKQINKPVLFIFYAAGIIPLIFSLILFFNSSILFFTGKSVTGKIVKKSIVYNKKGSTNNIYVLFADEKDIRHLILSTVTKEEFDNYNHRQDIEIYYLPYYPEFNALKKEVNFIAPLILLFISLIYFFAGKYIIWSINPAAEGKHDNGESMGEI